MKQLQSTDYTFTHAHGHGVLSRAPEDSVYFHPTLNPSGVPPPGKPQRYKTSVRPDLPASELPLPLPPPLPAGPAPGSAPLPPPSGPPPGEPVPTEGWVRMRLHRAGLGRMSTGSSLCMRVVPRGAVMCLRQLGGVEP